MSNTNQQSENRSINMNRKFIRDDSELESRVSNSESSLILHKNLRTYLEIKHGATQMITVHIDIPLC